MYWTLQLATQLDEAPWPATRNELIDYAIRSGLDIQVIENLEELDEEEGEYDSMSEIWPDYDEWRNRIEEGFDENNY